MECPVCMRHVLRFDFSFSRNMCRDCAVKQEQVEDICSAYSEYMAVASSVFPTWRTAVYLTFAETELQKLESLKRNW